MSMFIATSKVLFSDSAFAYRSSHRQLDCFQKSTFGCYRSRTSHISLLWHRSSPNDCVIREDVCWTAALLGVARRFRHCRSHTYRSHSWSVCSNCTLTACISIAGGVCLSSCISRRYSFAPSTSAAQHRTRTTSPESCGYGQAQSCVWWSFGASPQRQQ